MKHCLILNVVSIIDLFFFCNKIRMKDWKKKKKMISNISEQVRQYQMNNLDVLFCLRRIFGSELLNPSLFYGDVKTEMFSL